MFTIRWSDVFPPKTKAVVSWRKGVPEDQFPLHDHDFDELFWIESGRVEHEFGGKRCVMEVGELAFIRAADAHALKWVGPSGGMLVNVAFAPGVVSSLQTRLFPNEPISWWDEAEERRTWKLRPEQTRIVGQASRELSGNGDELWRAERFILNILALGQQSGARLQMRPGEPEWLVQARLAMESPVRLRKGVPALVALSGCTAEHVARTIRRLYGVTPTEWVNEARLGWAAERLRLSTDAIADVAAEAGFESLSHFYHLFRRVHGETPLRYRRRAQRPVV